MTSQTLSNSIPTDSRSLVNLPSRFYPLEFPQLDCADPAVRYPSWLNSSRTLTSPTSSSRSFVQFAQVIAVSFSPPVVKFCQVPLTRNTPVHARSVHDPHLNLLFPPLPPSTDFVQHLSQMTAKILAPPFAQHTPRESLKRFSDRQVFLHCHFL